MEGYRYLITFQLSEVIYRLTLGFLRGSGKNLGYRQKEQIEQAARSGKQNIAEGYAQKTSLKGYIKLLGVARGSLEELKLDYEDFLKRNDLKIWDKNDPRIREFRGFRVDLGTKFPKLPQFSQYPKPPQSLSFPQSPEFFCNLLITLISQTNFLLSRQIYALEEKHQKEGGFTEKLYRERINYRKNSPKSPKYP